MRRRKINNTLEAVARGTRLSLSFDLTLALTQLEDYDENEMRTKDSTRLVCVCYKKPPRAPSHGKPGNLRAYKGEVKKVEGKVFMACHCAQSIERAVVIVLLVEVSRSKSAISF